MKERDESYEVKSKSSKAVFAAVWLRTLVALFLLYTALPSVYPTFCSVQKGDLKSEMSAADFPGLVREYIDDLNSRHPALAAASGIHIWDSDLEDFSSQAITDEIASIRRFQSRLERIPPLALKLSDTFDYQILASNMKSRLLELEHVRTFERNPQSYNDLISTSLLQLTIFDYASPDIRLRHVIAKEKLVPRLLEQARANVRKPPPPLVKVAIDNFKGLATFVENDLPKAFASVNDPGLQSEFKSSTRLAADAVAEHIKHLQKAAPNPTATFALGRENYEAKLRYDEGVDVPLSDLLKVAYRELARNQEEFRKAAARVDGDRPPLEVWAKVQKEHPKAGELVAEAQRQLDALIRFIKDKGIVTLPSNQVVQVGGSPDFLRWSSATMWTPGAFESRSLPSRYLITDVDPKWTEKQKEEYLSSVNYPQLWSTSIHEAYPGHFVQGQYQKRADSMVRRTAAFAPATFVEGWAHYAEQMMLDEGFGEDDPKLRLGQLADALLRLCRFVVAIRLHTEGLTLEQASIFFMQNGYMGETPARIEAERGAFDPMYLVYSVGKLALLKLREDYRRYLGSEFSLRSFHDQLLSNGNAPLWVHRQLLMPGDRGRLLD